MRRRAWPACAGQAGAGDGAVTTASSQAAGAWRRVQAPAPGRSWHAPLPGARTPSPPPPTAAGAPPPAAAGVWGGGGAWAACRLRCWRGVAGACPVRCISLSPLLPLCWWLVSAAAAATVAGHGRSNGSHHGRTARQHATHQCGQQAWLGQREVRDGQAAHVGPVPTHAQGLHSDGQLLAEGACRSWAPAGGGRGGTGLLWVP